MQQSPNSSSGTPPIWQQKAITGDDIDQGIDRKSLSLLKKRFAQLNSERLKRIESALPERQHIFLHLLPLLFHCNHPMLPGYVAADAPAGVSGYSPSEQDIRLAKQLARSFKVRQETGKNRQIHGLFAMGSVGTVAHSDKSDLDIWVCHNPKLNHDALQLLQKKCIQLTAWAETLRLEAHFFPMNAEAFKRGEQSGLDSEASGSAQHYLLLDEFYRSSVQLAGRVPLWWLVPSQFEKRYDHYSSELLRKRFVRPAEVIDFGGIAHIPHGEFSGAGIWQLYKGIDSPYKSILKLLLLESYTRGQQPLSLTFKQLVYAGRATPDQLDAYALVYRRIEDYLSQHGNSARLELARRCFYFKVGKALSKPPRSREKSWQRSLLENLVHKWNWQSFDLKRLDNRHNWKAPQVISERRELVNELSASYRLLLEFVRSQGASDSIDAQELQVLGRKLHAAFERRAGKLEWINPGISNDLSESSLFLQFQNNAWRLFACRQNEWKASIKPLKQSRHLVELLLWSHGNDILRRHSQLDIDGDPLHSPDAIALQQSRQCLQEWLPLPLAQPSHEAYLRPSQCAQLLLLVNTDSHPLPELGERGLMQTSSSDDPLNFGRKQQSLITSIDLISRNSWNEVCSYHFRGTNSFTEAILHLLRLLPNGMPDLTLKCFTPGHGNTITQRLKALLLNISQNLFQNQRSSARRYIFSLAGHLYILQFKRDQPSLKECAHRRDLLRTLSWPQRHYSKIAIDALSLPQDPLHALALSSSSATLQIYYQLSRDKREAEVFIADERGSIFHCTQPFHSHQSLLRPLHRFLRRTLERHMLNNPKQTQDFGVIPIEFFEIDHNLQLKQHQVSTDVSQINLLDIEAIAECDSEGRRRYTLYCNQREFSSLLDGEQLYRRCADYIQSLRNSGERYPCYITDLDISQCVSQVAGDHPLQTLHFLQLKAEIEHCLNRSLLSH